MKSVWFPKQKILPWMTLLLASILCLLLVFHPLLSVNAVSHVAANSIDRLKHKRQHIDQQRQNVQKERDRLTNLQQEAEKRLTGLETNLRITDTNIKDSEFRLQQATQLLQSLQADLATAEVSFRERQQATIARLRYLQRSPIGRGWSVLLQSHNFNDFLSRRRQLKLVYQADQKILTKLTEQAKQIEQQKTQVAGKKNEIYLLRQQLLAQKADYQAQASLQANLIQRLNGDRIALEAAQNQLERESQEITALIQRKVAEAQAREAAAKANSRKNIFVRGTGIFTYPNNGRLSSPFGWRRHPILGYRRFHSGLDFAASYGSTIRAADTGMVIFSGWYGGYGKAIIINHGNGISTLYGHSSNLYVTEGQRVKRGQAIAAVGSTGLSTGPHLHFEVRKNGTPVNPANYL